MPIEVLVVGVDRNGSPHHVLEWSVEMGHRTGAFVEVVHGRVEAGNAGRADVEGPDGLLLSPAAADILHAITHRTTVMDAEPADALAVVARRSDGPLVVVGVARPAQGQSGGSVTQRLVDNGEHPVAIVAPARPRGPRAGFVVGIDGSASSLRALRWASGLAAPLGSGVYAVCVLPGVGGGTFPPLADGDDDAPEADALAALRELVAQVARETGAAVTGDVLLGHPVTRLLAASEGRFALVVGNPALGRPARDPDRSVVASLSVATTTTVFVP